MGRQESAKLLLAGSIPAQASNFQKPLRYLKSFNLNLGHLNLLKLRETALNLLLITQKLPGLSKVFSASEWIENKAKKQRS